MPTTGVVESVPTAIYVPCPSFALRPVPTKFLPIACNPEETNILLFLIISILPFSGPVTVLKIATTLPLIVTFSGIIKILNNFNINIIS